MMREGQQRTSEVTPVVFVVDDDEFGARPSPRREPALDISAPLRLATEPVGIIAHIMDA